MSYSNCSRAMCQCLAEGGYTPKPGKERVWVKNDVKVVVRNWSATSYVGGNQTQYLDFKTVSNYIQLKAFIARVKEGGG